MRAADPNIAAAKEAGLHYVNDNAPGIRRQRRGKSFAYFHADGKPLRDPATLKRIRSLVIPPAWTDVWICSDARGHVQATGRDAAGRKQHRYHPEWRTTRDGTKYDHVIAFAKALPKIRRQTAADMRKPGLPREKVVALAVQLLEKTLIRVGNDEYAKQHKHFGLTTFQDRHVQVQGRKAVFDFTGKSGVHRRVELKDERLAHLIKACQELPGQHLFRYEGDDSKLHDISSTDVNDYLHRVAGNGFTAKDFRTWAGTVLAARALQEIQSANGKNSKSTQLKKNIVRAIETVAKQLGNTPAICRKCYVHPAILNAYMDGSLVRTLKQRSSELSAGKEQNAVLHLLTQAARQGEHANRN
jgi:DNA topoisomerase-1